MEPPFQEATKFCSEKDIPIPNMNEVVPRFGRSRKGRGRGTTSLKTIIFMPLPSMLL